MAVLSVFWQNNDLGPQGSIFHGILWHSQYVHSNFALIDIGHLKENHSNKRTRGGKLIFRHFTNLAILLWLCTSRSLKIV